VIAGHSPAMIAQVLTRISHQEWEVETLFETDLAPLIHAGAKAKFEF
jgi:protein-L-isoaspartate(D-aspartate) O-methyltransferase